MVLRNLRDFLVSTVAAGSMLAAVSCTEVNTNTYVGYPDKGQRADIEMSDASRDNDLKVSVDAGVAPDYKVTADLGLDSKVLDSKADTLKADAKTSDILVADKSLPDAQTPDTKVDASAPDNKVPDQKLLDSQTPDMAVADLSVDKTSPDTYKAPDSKVATPDSTLADLNVADKSLPDTSYKADMAVAKPDTLTADATSPDYQIAKDGAVVKDMAQDGTVVIFKDGATADSGKGCTSLEKALTCLGTKYQTLTTPGWAAYEAKQNGYKNVITDENKFKQGVAAGNPCTASKIFNNQTCADYLKKATPGSAVVELKDSNNIRITGYLPFDQAMGLEALAKGKLKGVKCAIYGTSLPTAKITCFNK